MTNPYAPPRGEPSRALGVEYELRQRGRLFVSLICAGIAVFAVVTLFFSGVSSAGLLRTALTAGLVYALYQGRNWARVLTAVFLAIGGLLALIAVAQDDFGLTGAHAALLAAMLAFYFGASAMLLLSPAISAFFRIGRFQRFEGDSE